MMSTFTLPKYYFQNPLVRENAIYPGVGPPATGDEEIYYAYYQWVPLFLCFQCVCFYVPYGIIWKYMEGGKFKTLLETLIVDYEYKEQKKQNNKPPPNREAVAKDNSSLPDWMSRPELQSDKLGIAYIVTDLFKFAIGKDVDWFVEDLRRNYPEKRYALMRNCLKKAKKLHLAQALESFKTKVVRPDIIKYLFAQITFEGPTGQIWSIDINEMLPFLEEQQKEISLVEVLDHVMKNAKPRPMINNDTSFYFCEYRKLDVRYFYCEIISCLQLGLQLFLTNLFLGGQFFSYGFKILRFPFIEPEDREDTLALIFPKMTKCMFQKYGPSGTIETLDALCVLGVNIFNEKIFIFFWFWYIILALLSLFNLAYQAHQLYALDYTPRFIKKLKRPGFTKSNNMDYQYLMIIMTYHLKVNDWMILYCYSQIYSKTNGWEKIPLLIIFVKLFFNNSEVAGIDTEKPKIKTSLYCLR